MTFYAYNEPAWELPEPDRWDRNRVLVCSDGDILEEFWDEWAAGMRRLGREHLITSENCIDDWLVVEWAWRLGSTR